MASFYERLGKFGLDTILDSIACGNRTGNSSAKTVSNKLDHLVSLSGTTDVAQVPSNVAIAASVIDEMCCDDGRVNRTICSVDLMARRVTTFLASLFGLGKLLCFVTSFLCTRHIHTHIDHSGTR